MGALTIYIYGILDSYGVPDTASRRSLIGEAVLNKLEGQTKKMGDQVVRKPCVSEFKFGNCGMLTSTKVAQIPCRKRSGPHTTTHTLSYVQRAARGTRH